MQVLFIPWLQTPTAWDSPAKEVFNFFFFIFLNYSTKPCLLLNIETSMKSCVKTLKREGAQALSPEVRLVGEGPAGPVFTQLQEYRDIFTKMLSYLTYCSAVSHVPFFP